MQTRPPVIDLKVSKLSGLKQQILAAGNYQGGQPQNESIGEEGDPRNRGYIHTTSTHHSRNQAAVVFANLARRT